MASEHQSVGAIPLTLMSQALDGPVDERTFMATIHGDRLATPMHENVLAIILLDSKIEVRRLGRCLTEGNEREEFSHGSCLS